MKEFFKNIKKIEYEGVSSKNPLSFRFYDKNRVVLGKTMGEHLKFAMSYWHTLVYEGTDMFGRSVSDKKFGAEDPLEIYKNKVYAAFELMEKLQIEYFCFHDRDIAPEGETLEETNRNLDIIVDVIESEMKRTGIKLLWATANCFNHPRYMHGAGTSPNADVFAYAAAQIKKALEITVRLGGKGYVFWGGREGYDTLLNTDMKFELDNMARLLRLAVDYGRKIGFEGDFYIEPKPKEPTKHQYDFDASTAIMFLRHYGLDKDFKLNIEANHATLAGHTFQHELCVARINGMFGSIDANEGDPLLGWDTDIFPVDLKSAVLCMREVILAGGFTNGGLNFDAKARRGSFTLEDIFYSYISGMDTFAHALLIVEEMFKQGFPDNFIKNRYRSYNEGIGKKIVNQEVTIEELEEYALKMEEVRKMESGRQEMLENELNVFMLQIPKNS